MFKNENLFKLRKDILPTFRRNMAKSKYEYVKKFEKQSILLPECYIIIRLDGKNFTKFSQDHQFQKPNDKKALKLMTACAKEVMIEFPDIKLSYGQSDEYSFLFRKDTTAFGRRSDKLISVIASCFTGNYIKKWSEYLNQTTLKYIPMFDCRAIEYPNEKLVMDYFAWRQVDTHINNQYNTCYWALVGSGMAKPEAQETLAGSTIIWDIEDINQKTKKILKISHEDIISKDFWEQHRELLI